MHLLYIDPGTGSMLFSVFIGLAAASYFLFRTLIIRARTLFLGKSKTLQGKSDYVIYNEAAHYWPVFQMILDEFESRQIEAQYLTSVERDPVFEKKYNYVHSEYIGEGNKAFKTLNFLEAGICLMTTPGLEVYQLKRSKLCRHYCHILHDIGDATCYRLFGIDWYDSLLLSGEYQIKDVRYLEETRSMPKKELIVVGSTYLDYYKNKIKELSSVGNQALSTESAFTVLVSPSWGPGSLLNTLGEKLLESLKNTGWRVIVRPHPQSKTSEAELLKRLESEYPSFIWDYNSENLESMSRADVMISDFSTIIFDYSFLFNKPVLFHNASFNKEMYDAGDIETEPWKFEAIKDFGVKISESDLPGIKDIIQKAVSDTSLSSERDKAKKTAWQNIGGSAKAVVDALVGIKEKLG